MNGRKMGWGLLLCTGLASAQAAGGLVAPSADTVWPQWQARISLHTAGMLPLNVSGHLNDGAAQRGIQGGAVLGDYYFAKPSFGRFRASGGLLVGSQAGGLPVIGGAAGPRLGVSLSSGGVAQTVPGGDAANGLHQTSPYLGVGFSSAPWRNGPAISADLGLVAGHGRALFGNQGVEGTLRELRLSPVLQLGVRYAF